MTNILSLSIARLNRIRRKPPLEILTFLVKRPRQFVVHARDRIKMALGAIELEDEEFFDKIELGNLSLAPVKKTIEQRDIKKAKAELVAHMHSRTVPFFYFDKKEKKQIIAVIEKQFPESRRRTIELADEFLKHRFQLLGKNVDFGENIDWHFNIYNAKKWPLSFSPNIDYFSSNRPGDIKIPWELNRNQHFLVLGKAYWYTEDEKYAIEFTDQVSSWIRNNPYKRGINWMEGIEAAIRLFSWIWAYNFFMDSRHFNEKIHFEFLKSIYVHAKFIREHLSDKWLINNNHLLAEAVGLTFVGIMFPEFKDAQTWRTEGIKILEKELNAQIVPDGFTWEQSTGYHKFVTDLVLYTALIMVKNGVDIPKGILLKLSQMIEFVNCVSRSDGLLPLVGDEDQGRVIKLSEATYDDASSTITIGSILLDRRDWPRTKSEETVWLFPNSNLAENPANVMPTSRLFKESGIMVMREGDKCMLFLAGSQNAKYSHASHKHSDELSLVLDAFGVSFLVDPGTYTYFGDFAWRKYFKSRCSHNTVVIDERDPVGIKEVFESSRVPTSRILGCRIGDGFDWIEAEYDGYKALSITRRVFFIKPEYWVVIDAVQGKGQHVYDQYFHFNCGMKIEFDEQDKSVRVGAQELRLKIIPLMTSGLSGEILHGEVSPRYGEKCTAEMIRYRKKGNSPQFFVALLFPYRTDEGLDGEEVKVSQIDVYGDDNRLLDVTDAIGIKVDFRGFEDYLVCSCKGEQNFRFADVERTGKIVYTRRTTTAIIKDVLF